MGPGDLSFDALYAAYYPRIRRYLARLIGLDEAEDVAQEVFLKAGRSLGEFRGDSAPLTWIYRIATNAALDRVRSPGYRASAASTPIDESCAVRPATAEDQAIRGEMSECVQDLVAQLPENYRTVLLLSELEGMKNGEIAEVLGVSLDTVKIRLHRARARLKQSLEAECRFYRDPHNTLLCDIKPAP